ncbi:MAG: membrane dipeptidase [Anaerolineales bacterium]|nr:membrane dipeptidase [Anaerolineales bacterium]
MIVDAHLDLAYNALRYGRNLLAPLEEIREFERKRPTDNGYPTVSFSEIRRGGVGLVFGTIFVEPFHGPRDATPPPLSYREPKQAKKPAVQQLDYYHRLVDENEFIRLVGDVATLDAVIESQAEVNPLVGIVPLMEGADPVQDFGELEEWFARGIRIIGPAWDDTRYASGAWRGTREGFTTDGYALMEVMADLGFILDLTHLSETAVKEALERYDGPLIASHSNCRTLAPHVEQRHLIDDHIRLLGERGGVMGIVLANRFLKKGHAKGERKELVTLEHVVAHIDHVCQLTGSADHVGIGSDFDGGFGWADIPAELNSIADLHLLGGQLKERGYEAAHVEQIMGGNWVRLLREVWQE